MLYVYGIFTENTHRLVYIGITWDPVARFKQHKYKVIKEAGEPCYLEVLEETDDFWSGVEDNWITYARFLGCDLINKSARHGAGNWRRTNTWS